MKYQVVLGNQDTTRRNYLLFIDKFRFYRKRHLYGKYNIDYLQKSLRKDFPIIILFFAFSNVNQKWENFVTVINLLNRIKIV